MNATLNRFDLSDPNDTTLTVDKPTPACRTVKQRVRTNAKLKSKVAVLDDAMKLKTTLRETLAGVNALIRSIKNERRQTRLLRSTVASLRKLQNV